VIRPLLDEAARTFAITSGRSGPVRRRPVERGSEVRPGPGAGRPWRRSGSTPSDPGRNGHSAWPGPGRHWRAGVSVARGSCRPPFGTCASTATGLPGRTRHAAAPSRRRPAMGRRRGIPAARRAAGGLARPGVGRRWRNAARRAGRGDAGRDRGLSRVRRGSPRSTCRGPVLCGTIGGNHGPHVKGLRPRAGRRGLAADASRASVAPALDRRVPRDRAHAAGGFRRAKGSWAVPLAFRSRLFAELRPPLGHFLALLNPH
jgi:hypothetical protein